MIKNIWLHSIVLIIIGALAIALCQHLAWFALTRMGSSIDFGSALLTLLKSPLLTLSILLPGLTIGWYTPRHPLVIGALCGVIAAAVPALQPVITGAGDLDEHMFLYSQIGWVLSVMMTVAVASFAGRALRQRLQSNRNST